jgi:hypothetical protein
MRPLPTVRRVFPLAQGAVADAARDSDLFTEYDGRARAGLARPARLGAAVSPTSLEDLAKCPFRYFSSGARPRSDR